MTIFKDQDDAVTKFLAVNVASVPQLAFVKNLDPDDVFAMLLSAERTVADRLRVDLEPTQVFSEHDPSDADISALAGMPYLVEPGYDYNPDYFMGDRWGYLVTRRHPIISVQQIAFTFAGVENTFIVPSEWLRLDKKYGHIRLVPSGAVVAIPLNTYLLTVYGGGRTIPNAIRVKYVSGIADINKEFPDLVSFIRRVATMMFLRDRWPGQSESISADGLSQSSSFDINALVYGANGKGGIEAEYDQWQQRLHGVRLTVA